MYDVFRRFFCKYAMCIFHLYSLIFVFTFLLSVSPLTLRYCLLPYVDTPCYDILSLTFSLLDEQVFICINFVFWSSLIDWTPWHHLVATSSCLFILLVALTMFLSETIILKYRLHILCIILACFGLYIKKEYFCYWHQFLWFQESLA